MKHISLYLLLFSVFFCYSQEHGYTLFESGTLELWTNSDGSLTNLTIEQPGSNSGDYFYLKKFCDGSNTINGEMAIKNPEYFRDNYMIIGALISMYVKNENTFDLHLRLGFTDNDGTKIVMTTPTIVPPSIGVWQEVSFLSGIQPYFFTLIEGPNSIEDVLSGTFEMKIIHNENISFDGAYENGNFEIDNVGTGYLAGINDFKNESVIIYPIPTKDIIYIKTSSTIINRIEIYDLLGRKKIIKHSNLYEVDLSNSENGIYLLKIYSESGIVTRKIIKN